MKRVISFFSLLLILNSNSTAQTSCSNAVMQLQHYAQGVNQMYYHYYTNAGSYCGFNWAYCLNNLNYWYFQQCNYVNQWYNTIAYQCASIQPTHKPAPTRQIHDRQAPEMDVDEIEDLEEDIADAGNGRKKVTLQIPTDATGWQAR